jgi:hypothetical protein
MTMNRLLLLLTVLLVVLLTGCGDDRLADFASEADHESRDEFNHRHDQVERGRPQSRMHLDRGQTADLAVRWRNTIRRYSSKEPVL